MIPTTLSLQPLNTLIVLPKLFLAPRSNRLPVVSTVPSFPRIATWHIYRSRPISRSKLGWIPNLPSIPVVPGPRHFWNDNDCHKLAIQGQKLGFEELKSSPQRSSSGYSQSHAPTKRKSQKDLAGFGGQLKPWLTILRLDPLLFRKAIELLSTKRLEN